MGILARTRADVVENALYGVDIQQQAVEICRLRLWLSLVVDYDMGLDPFQADRNQFRAAIGRISQLPNLEMNFHRGDSLHDHVSGVPVVVAEPIHRLATWQSDRKDNPDADAPVIDPSESAFARFFKALVKDQTVLESIPFAVPWDDLGKKMKVPASAKRIRGKLNVPRERFWITAETVSEERAGDSQGKIVVFGAKRIRRAWVADQWFFSVVDIVAVLTDSDAPNKYWATMKRREAATSGLQLSTICRRLKLTSSDGKGYNTDCANTQAAFRIIQSIPSRKAEPFKRWLADLTGTRRPAPVLAYRARTICETGLPITNENRRLCDDLAELAGICLRHSFSGLSSVPAIVCLRCAAFGRSQRSEAVGHRS